jgi:hypothetical protein
LFCFPAAFATPALGDSADKQLALNAALAVAFIVTDPGAGYRLSTDGKAPHFT